MDYLNIYINLIETASERVLTSLPTEKHHVIPRSLGGSNDPDNLVRLTVREHYLAHLLLYRLGFSNQIFAVQAILQDALNKNRPHRYQCKGVRFKRWIRRAITVQQAALRRQARKDKYGFKQPTL